MKQHFGREVPIRTFVHDKIELWSVNKTNLQFRLLLQSSNVIRTHKLFFLYCGCESSLANMKVVSTN